MRTEVLRVQNLTKAVNGQQVLENVNFHLFAGELVTIVGFQNSGKAVLTAILSGESPPDSGRILVEDEAVRFSDIQDAQRAGVYCVRAQPQLIQSMSIEENLFVMAPVRTQRSPIIPHRRFRAMARKVLQQFGLQYSPGAIIRNLPAEKQRIVELVKISMQAPKVIVFADGLGEAFAASPEVWRVCETLMEQGTAILTVSNKLESSLQMAARIYPLHAGIIGKCIDREDYSKDLLLEELNARAARPQKPDRRKESPEAGPILLSLRGFRVRAERARIDLDLHAGEIVGLVVPDSNEAHSLSNAMFGGERQLSGELLVDGIPQRLRRPADAIHRGIALVPEDPRRNAIFNKMSLQNNIALWPLAETHHPAAVVPDRMASYLTQRLAAFFHIRNGGSKRPVWQLGLSASECRKVLLARWSAMNQRIYIILDPFADVDERQTEELAGIFRALAQRGAGVLILSPILYKLPQVCDRCLHWPRGSEVSSGN